MDVPAQARVQIVGLSYHLVPIDEVLDTLYLGEDLNYVFIDVGVMADGPDVGTAWIRPSAHHPSPDGEVWDPHGTGPFKLVNWVLPPGSKLTPKIGAAD